MNKRMNNKKCSFKRFMLVKCLTNILHFTKHDNYLCDCSWTNCNFIHINKKNSHHRENYVFIRTNNFIKLRLLTNDCKMCDCSNILQLSIIWIYFNITRELIFESIFFFKIVDNDRNRIRQVSKNKSFVMINKFSITLNFICRIESTCSNLIKSTRFFFEAMKSIELIFLSSTMSMCVYIERLALDKKKENLHHINSTRFDEIDLHMNSYKKKRRTSIIFMLYI